MKHLQTVIVWAITLALEFLAILGIVMGFNALNPAFVESIAALAESSAPILATVVLGAMGARTFVTAARNRVGLRNAGDRAALQAWVRGRQR